MTLSLRRNLLRDHRRHSLQHPVLPDAFAANRPCRAFPLQTRPRFGSKLPFWLPRLHTERRPGHFFRKRVLKPEFTEEIALELFAKPCGNLYLWSKYTKQERYAFPVRGNLVNF